MYSIKKVHLEPTQLCQAMCPMCDRVTLDGELNHRVNNTSLSIQDVKNIFSKEFIQQLDEMYMCGNLGDPMLAPDCLEIFEYFREANPNIYLSMNTNGGARKPEFWKNLANLTSHVTFSIDGLEDTNGVYRKGVIWYNIINNVKEFINAGGKAKWDYLVFEHNEHQIELAEQLSKELGFVEFRPKTTNRYDKERPAWQTYWRGKQREVLKPPKQEKYQSEVVNNPLKDREHVAISPKCVKNREIYVAATGHVFPCCWAHTSAVSSQNISLEERLDIRSLVVENNAKEVGINKAVEWFENIFERWDTDDKPFVCSAKCNMKQDTVKLQYV
jgi:MoaA/NifB/PqqE/SkfB family radical SAM enzyme